MQDAVRFTLSKLIEIGPLVSRYMGTLRDGQQSEICLFPKVEPTESKAVNDTELLDFWFQRCRLAQLINCNYCLKILDFGKSVQQPFIALSGPYESLEVLVDEQSEVVKSQFEELAVACLTALVACAEVGLFVGGVTCKTIRRCPRTQTWQLDISGLRSDRLCDQGLTRSSPGTINGTIATSTDLTIDEPDSAGTLGHEADLKSLAVLLLGLIERLQLGQNLAAQGVSRVFEACLPSGLMEIPSAKVLLHRLLHNDSSVALPAGMGLSSEQSSSERPSSQHSGRLSQSPSGDHYEATLEVTSDIAVPAGLLLDGTQLGRYKIRERLGSGGMGAVYRAEDLAADRSVAVKILNKQVSQDSATAKRFAKEARLLARANNPYVANLYEVVSEGDLPYMVVEFVEGGTLGALLKASRPLNEKFTLTVLIDASRGLAAAHSRGIVHRDFKPDNVLLTSAAKDWLASNSPFATPASVELVTAPEIGKIFAKVSDFGLARTAQQSESMALTREGALLGTPLYMSPEQCQGKPTDARTDVYSIGITLFHLLTGKPPFEADTQVALLNLHCNAAPPSLKKLRPDLSDALAHTIEKCLAKNPDARYADAGELVIDLESMLRGQPTSLGLHPPILSLNDPDVLRFEHAWELRSSPQQLWPYISNTDRVNQAIGLPAVSYSIRQDPNHGAQRFAEAKVAGLLIRWQEHPYEWIEGRRMSVLREFSHGPFRWFVNVVELTPTLGGGTLVTQTLTVTPRNWVGKQLAKIQLGQKSKANFGRAYEQIDSYINQSEFNRADRDPFSARHELRPAQKQRLESRMATLKERRIDPIVVDALSQFLENASNLEVARIRPIAFAERFKFEPTQVINACLEGSRLGIFSLMWDIMCPSCRIPSSIQETLATIKDHGYCEACNLDFGIDLAESVELIFRAHPEIREVTTATYCIGGPAWSRHVVAQVRLAAGERFACELNLPEGAYVVRGQQLPFTVDLRVSHGSVVKRTELSLARPPASPRTTLGIGSQVIHLCNDSSVDQQIRIERTAGRHDALSAARASTMALFRELFPNEVLSTDQIVSVAHITVMRIKIRGTKQLYESMGDSLAFGRIRGSLQTIFETIKEQSGAVVKTIGEGVLASFPDSLSAVKAATALLQLPYEKTLPIAIAAHSGAAMVATLEDRLDYFGKTLQAVEQMLLAADAQTLQVSATITDATEVQSYLRHHQFELTLNSEIQLSDGTIVFQAQSSQIDRVSRSTISEVS